MANKQHSSHEHLALAMSWSQQWRVALRAAVLLLVLCGGIYTPVVTWVAQTLFPQQASGSLLWRQHIAVGSSLVGQSFVSARYFSGRPSAVDYLPMATAGSNLAVNNPQLRQRVAADSHRLQQRDGVLALAIPVDLLAASGSGLDPHISVAAATLQIPRIAALRQLSPAQLQALVRQATTVPQWGLFGQASVNVLQLNLAVDDLSSAESAHDE